MIILFFVLLAIMLAILYYELRIATSKLSKNVFKDYIFNQKKFMKRDIFIISPKEKKNNIVILYLHGGSYVGELEKYHWNFFKDIINDTGSTIIVPDYPLAPEHTYLEVFEIMEPLYNEIIKKLDKNTKFIIMGDSAGAGLALALYQKSGELNQRLPNKIILISPWLVVRMENPEINKIKDPILNKRLLKLSGQKYAGKNGMKSYLVNPIIGPVDKLKSVYILSGTMDLLNPDAKKFALKNKQNVNLIEYKDAIHNFPLMKHKKEVLYSKEGYNKIVDIILS